jgi:hypothetical protein
MVLLKVVHIRTLYKLLGSTISDGCNTSIVPKIGIEEEKNHKVSGEAIVLWHQRLEHNGEKRIQVLHAKGMDEGMSKYSLDFDIYEHFVYGKYNRVRFPSSAMREEVILQLVHNDVFGLLSILSLGKYMYYVSFIDDFSRNKWIYFLEKRSKVFEKFKELKDFVKNQTEKRIKVLRMDNGGEFCENKFK